MPVIAAFYGMIIRIYHADHNPPHFHVQYGEVHAVVALASGKLLAGRLSPRQRRLVEEWRTLRIADLERAWDAAQAMKRVKRIKPLE